MALIGCGGMSDVTWILQVILSNNQMENLQINT